MDVIPQALPGGPKRLKRQRIGLPVMPDRIVPIAQGPMPDSVERVHSTPGPVRLSDRYAPEGTILG